ncbi:MAG TPA: helix-turn-helix domain-containing protein [Bacillus sp. (in: firmicutes)]|nr:helix-turn-helix domain-containing protein [Bacillus sp. (in: firmicutes)]HVI21609.1 helix-turn-helix domain-containing protein [Bacillus sp. (in: firmicutes)]
MKSITLDKAYKYEYDADVKERILLIRRVLTDKQHIETVAQELHKSRAWAYKWYKRYNDKGIEGLKDKPRSGRPSLVKHDLMIKIRKEMEDSDTGWDFRQVMDIIQKRTGIKYHEVHIYRLLHNWGFSAKVPQKRFIKTSTTRQEKNKFKKEFETF